jgi:hypothetical protein
MLEPLKYLWRTVGQEISDEFTIVQEIVRYYRREFAESMETRERMAGIKAVMGRAQSYKQWRGVSQLYDQLGVVEQQINEVYSPYYDYEYLQEVVRCMAEARAQGDAFKLIEIIRSHSDRNIANTNCSFLYRHAYNRSKLLIEQYQQELAKAFEAIIKADVPQNKKLEFFG